MMFREKSFGAAPPFLQLDDSEEENEKENEQVLILEKIKNEIRLTDENNMLAISEATNIDSIFKISEASEQMEIKSEQMEKMKCIEDGASDISSDDEVLEACTPTKPYTKPAAGNEDDKMSLSSLSSTEDKINRKSHALDAASQEIPLSQVGDYYYPPDTNPYYYSIGGNTAYESYNNQYMSSHDYIQPYVPGFPTLIPGGYVQSEYPVKSEDVPTATVTEFIKDPTEQILATVIERVKNELKQILKRDINKRMIESIAYKRYDSWWDEQVQNKNKPSKNVM